MPEETEYLTEEEMKEEAVQAGIPRSVVEGKTKLSDHFSKEYIDWKCNREEGVVI